MSGKRKRYFEKEIIQALIDNSYGMTVQHIARKIEASRNTVYRYLGRLEGKNKVFKHEVGSYNLYYSTEGRQISRDIVLSFYKGLLTALNDEIQLNPYRYKVIGKKIAQYITIPFDVEDLQKLVNADKTFKLDNLKILSSLKPYFTLLHDKITLKDIKQDKDKKRYIIHFVDSDLLEEELKYIYHF